MAAAEAPKIVPVPLSHPILGSITGRLYPSDVVQFRSVPFARIPGRFRQSVLVDSLEDEERDCTQYGYACPQIPQPTEMYGGIIPWEELPKYDEFKCLNLTISTPKQALESGKGNLPVMVFLHGGGFREATGNVNPFHNTARMVEVSVSEGHPVIVVNIHYRLNWFGLLASQDLLAACAGNGEAPCNFALYDQRNAFFWIHRHISGFGGDPSNITAFGESAGAMSLGMHLCSTVPLFKRVILMSGTPGASPPLGLEYQEPQYQALLMYCGIDEHDPERLEKLKTVPIEKLVAAITDLHVPLYAPLPHPDFFPVYPTSALQNELIPKCEWVEDIIIGDLFFEGFVLYLAQTDLSQDVFIQAFHEAFGLQNAQELLDMYGISLGVDRNLFWQQSMLLMGDLLFSEPAHALAKSLVTSTAGISRKIYRYTATIRNPFPGSRHYHVPGHHAIDLVHMFGNVTFRMPQARQRATSDEWVRRWVRFGAGFAPWDEYEIQKQKIAIADARLGWVVRERAEDEEVSKDDDWGERRYKQWEFIGRLFSGFDLQQREMVRFKIMSAGRDLGGLSAKPTKSGPA